MKSKKAFTLIELVSVLVILAILAIIVTPLVLNIIKKARIAADKRSIDAYGRSIELAIADYLLDNGTFPTSIEDLTIEYSGDRVVCSTTQLNSDSSVYLADCTVNNREVKDYTYGTDKSPLYEAYSVGNEVTYNNVDYYVIKDSDTTEASVTLLKAEPLTTEEVNTYGGVGTANNHVNMYLCQSSDNSCYQTAIDYNGYGGMAYYSSVNCGWGTGSNETNSGCTTDYEQSEIKYVVDVWKKNQAPLASEARLITLDDLTNNLGYELYDNGSVVIYQPTNSTPMWVYNSNYHYFTMSQYNDSPYEVWFVYADGKLPYSKSVTEGSVVRPVITISKSALN